MFRARADRRTRRTSGVLIAVVAAVVSAMPHPVAAAPSAPAGAGRGAPAHVPHPAIPTPDKRVFMVSDSVGLGAKTAMGKAFPSDWQVTVTGKPGIFVEQLASNYVQYQPAYMFGDSAIVAGGYNYPYWDPPRFDRAIDQMVNTLLAKGVKRIFWVTMREITPYNFSGWNGLSSAYKALYLAYPYANNQLRNAQGRFPELSIIDWAAVSDISGLTYDGLHLNTTGANQYSSLAALAVKTAANRLPAGAVTELQVAGQNGVPEDATAAALNLTVFNPRRQGWLTAYPCGGEMPVVSSLNFRPHQIVAGTAVVPIGVDGKICIYQSTEAHLIVDVNGAFGAGSGFVPITPVRATDTRYDGTGALAANTERTVHLGAVEGAPEGEFTAVINFTILGTSTFTEARLYTCGTTPPAVPNRSVEAGFVQSIPMVVRTDANGDVCVTTNAAAHVLVDMFGTFTAEADIHPLPTERVMDTRSGAIPAAGSVLTLQVAGTAGVAEDPAPTAAMLSVTLNYPLAIGWATAYPCADGMPPTSIINVVPLHQQTNRGLIPVDANGQLCVYISVSAHVLLDLSGWTGAAFTPLTPARLIDTRWL